MMPLLEETTKRDRLTSSRDIKVEPDEQTKLKNAFSSVGFASPFANPTLFTPSQFIMASQFMAASGLALPTNPAFFHPGLLGPLTWPAPNSPPSPPNSNPELSPAPKTRKTSLNNNNNNNIVTSSNEVKTKKRWKEDANMSSPTSSSSPPSSTEIKETNRDKQFTCTICNRSFGYKHVLQNHERTHTGEKPFECPECFKRFTRDHHLKTHLRLHTGERPYHCDRCPRKFVQVANLRRHLRVHTGERPYACEHCPTKFSDSNQLKAHLLIHTNKKPFECERCCSRFRRRHHLSHHKCNGGGTDVVVEDTNMDEQPDEHERTLAYEPEQTEPQDLSMRSPLSTKSSSTWGEFEDDFCALDLRGNPKS